jgi:hypothetical protein
MVKDSDVLDSISLTHGQARWAMQNFNMLSSESESTFDAFIKSLRRDGVPFADEEKGVGAGFNLKYRYENLMELALALTLRTQGIVSRDMVKLIANHRTKLRSFFRTAYLDRGQRGGELEGLYIGPHASPDNYGKRLSEFRSNDSDTQIMSLNAEKFIHLSNISGWHLDLSLVYLPGGTLTMFNFDLVKASKAVSVYIMGHKNLYPRPPIPLTDIAVDIVRLAQGAPEIKRGPKP